jgi:hypothetical protein
VKRASRRVADPPGLGHRRRDPARAARHPLLGVSACRRISRLIHDHFPLAFCPACAGNKLGVSVFDFRNAAQMLAVEPDFAIARRVCCDCGSTGELLGLTSGASEPPGAYMDGRRATPARPHPPRLGRTNTRFINSSTANSPTGASPYKILPRISGGPGNCETCDACEETITKKQRDSIQRIWGAYSNGDFCDACDEVIPGDEYVIEGISVDGHGKMGLQFHSVCFALWDELRREPS